MKNIAIFTILEILISLSWHHFLPAQSHPELPQNCAETEMIQKEGQNVRILFWNLENLFDHRDDSVTLDEEFTGSGARHWTYQKMQEKLVQIAKAILAAGAWDPPAIIGFCEAENRYVLNKLIYESPLKSFQYRIIHKDSPDPRGIDVALLFRSSLFLPVHTEWITIRFPEDPLELTREILYVKGVLLERDSIHLFVNHWPSRRGGVAASAPRRHFVASVLRKKADSIAGMFDRENPDSGFRMAYPYILIMGDFNDEPYDASLLAVLQARPDTHRLRPTDLINLMAHMTGKEGSHKFREHWGILDQFIVTGSFCLPSGPLYIPPSSVRIFQPDFLLEDDPKFLGKKPKRTYQGPRYQGGISDHLPVVLDIRVSYRND